MLKDLITMLAIPVIAGVVVDLVADLIKQKVKEDDDNDR